MSKFRILTTCSGPGLNLLDRRGAFDDFGCLLVLADLLDLDDLEVLFLFIVFDFDLDDLDLVLLFDVDVVFLSFLFLRVFEPRVVLLVLDPLVFRVRGSNISISSSLSVLQKSI